jgi:phosphohistidine phosphatase
MVLAAQSSRTSPSVIPRTSRVATAAARLSSIVVRVYLCRHAKAAPGEPDEARELTGKGRRQAEELGERLAAAAEPPVLVLTSPLVRARQTAEAIAEATGAPVRLDRRLAPGATLAGLRQAVADAEGPVAAVGHQPDCSQIALAASGVDPGFSPGAMATLDLDE